MSFLKRHLQHEIIDPADSLMKLRLEQSASVSEQTSEAMLERALLLTQYDSGRALLASSALRYTVALSLAEERASMRMPQSADRFKAIVDAYADRAAQIVRKW